MTQRRDPNLHLSFAYKRLNRSSRAGCLARARRALHGENRRLQRRYNASKLVTKLFRAAHSQALGTQQFGRLAKQKATCRLPWARSDYAVISHPAAEPMQGVLLCFDISVRLFDEDGCRMESCVLAALLYIDRPRDGIHPHDCPNSSVLIVNFLSVIRSNIGFLVRK